MWSCPWHLANGRVELKSCRSLTSLSNILSNVVVELLLLFRKLVGNVLALGLLGLELDYGSLELEDLVLYLAALDV